MKLLLYSFWAWMFLLKKRPVPAIFWDLAAQEGIFKVMDDNGSGMITEDRCGLRIQSTHLGLLGLVMFRCFTLFRIFFAF